MNLILQQGTNSHRTHRALKAAKQDANQMADIHNRKEEKGKKHWKVVFFTLKIHPYNERYVCKSISAVHILKSDVINNWSIYPSQNGDEWIFVRF